MNGCKAECGRQVLAVHSMALTGCGWYRGESVGYSPVGLAAAAALGLATLSIARAMLPQTSVDKTDSYRHSKE